MSIAAAPMPCRCRCQHRLAAPLRRSISPGQEISDQPAKAKEKPYIWESLRSWTDLNGSLGKNEKSPSLRPFDADYIAPGTMTRLGTTDHTGSLFDDQGGLPDLDNSSYPETLDWLEATLPQPNKALKPDEQSLQRTSNALGADDISDYILDRCTASAVDPMERFIRDQSSQPFALFKPATDPVSFIKSSA